MAKPVTLDTLPFELLSHIASCLDHAHSLLQLSITCQRLQQFVNQEGWHAFVSSHFPRYNGPPLWRDAARSLTSLSRSWDKRALNARFILPQANISVRHLRKAPRRPSGGLGDGEPSADAGAVQQTNARPPPRDRYRRQTGQTMGYHPVLDCAEQWNGGSWTDRDEVVVVGAGAEVLVRNRRKMNGRSSMKVLEQSMAGASLRDSTVAMDDHGHGSWWRSWRDERCTDGKDDVSTLRIVRNEDADQMWTNEVIVGRASGGLERVRIGDAVATTKEFATNGRPVRSMNMSRPDGGMLAVGLGSKDVALYSLDTDEYESRPVHEFSAQVQGQTARTWSTHFLGPHRLAVGHGVSEKPLDIYEVRPDGVSEQPMRQFPALREKLYGPTLAPAGRNPSDAVYSIAPIPENSRGTSNPCNIFATGWYSGAIRLHDLRSPEAAVTTFVDSVEAGAAVYSVLPIGVDRIIAGTALHAKMQVFDLRAGPFETYVAPDVALATRPETGKKNGYSLFLARDFKSSRKESSVYSLAMASPFSTTVYAGLEGSIMQIDLFSSSDKHPDTIYTPSTDNKVRNQRERYYASLAMMDFSSSNKLLIQRYFGRKQKGIWDDRWLNLT